jgi:spermidine synthase
VREYDDRREMLHGRTVHGVQLTAPGARTIPTSYYGREGPLGELMALLRRSGHPARVGAIGLGAGTAGCYARPGDRWDLFEINPAVVELARDTTLFHFLADCVPGARVIVGDGRRSLSDLADARYDFLVLDAFSSDAVPVHLLTREAFSLYVGRLQPDGIIAVHISNRYLDLAPVLAANAHALNLSIRSRLDIAPAGAVRSSSRWVALARSASALQPLDARDWQLLPPEPGFRPWTDDYASLLPVLRIMR